MAANAPSLASAETPPAARLTARRLVVFLLLVLFAVFTDLWTKEAVYNWAKAVEPQAIPLVEGFLYFRAVENTGGVFGMLQGNNIVFVAFSIVAIGVIFAFLFGSRKAAEGPVLTALGLILGGALGNFWDRVNYHYVRDFIHFTFWPTFNVADSYICVGTAILCVAMLFERGEEEKKPAA